MKYFQEAVILTEKFHRLHFSKDVILRYPSIILYVTKILEEHKIKVVIN